VKNDFASIENCLRIVQSVQPLSTNATLQQMLRLSKQGQRECHFRMVLHQLTDQSYQSIQTVISIKSFVDDCADMFLLQPVLPPSDTSFQILHLDLKLCHISLGVLVSNASKYGPQDARPLLSVHVGTQDVRVSVWNAKGEGHAVWLQQNKLHEKPWEASERSASLRKGGEEEDAHLELAAELALMADGPPGAGGSSSSFSFGSAGASSSSSFSFNSVSSSEDGGSGSVSASFMQRMRTRSEAEEASRHGLSLCDRCCRHAGWQLHHQVDAAGTTFSVVMPLSVVCRDVRLIAKALQRRRDESSETEKKSSKNSALGSWVKVAVLEDNSFTQMLYKRELKSMCASQMIGSFFVEGRVRDEVHGFVSKCMRENVHIVVFDRDLSSALDAEERLTTTGTVLMQQLKRQGFTGLCVSKTADDSEDDVNGLLKAGFDIVLPKQGDFATQLSDGWHNHFCSPSSE